MSLISQFKKLFERKQQVAPKPVAEVLHQAIKHLKKNELNKVGIFRMTGGIKRVKVLLTRLTIGDLATKSLPFENDKTTNGNTPVNDVTSLIKLCLNSMDERLISGDILHYLKNFVKICMVDKDKTKKIVLTQEEAHIVKRLLLCIPHERYSILMDFMSLLSAILDNADTNLMNSHNLAICTGQNVCGSDNDSKVITQILFDNYRVLFSSDFVVSNGINSLTNNPFNMDIFLGGLAACLSTNARFPKDKDSTLSLRGIIFEEHSKGLFQIMPQRFF